MEVKENRKIKGKLKTQRRLKSITEAEKNKTLSVI